MNSFGWPELATSFGVILVVVLGFLGWNHRQVSKDFDETPQNKKGRGFRG